MGNKDKHYFRNRQRVSRKTASPQAAMAILRRRAPTNMGDLRGEHSPAVRPCLCCGCVHPMDREFKTKKQKELKMTVPPNVKSAENDKKKRENLTLYFQKALTLHPIRKQCNMVGREKERQELMAAYQADESQFVAVYGRRRVGKTYLVRETFASRFTFQHSGLANTSMADQLLEWDDSLRRAGLIPIQPSTSWLEAFRQLSLLLTASPHQRKLVFIDELPWLDTPKSKFTTPNNWLEAFRLLKELVRTSDAKRKIIFIDELSWMDTPRSDMMKALEHFWNNYASARKDIVLVVCGSATSWIISNIVMNHGGLHNRLTNQILLRPFTLSECEQYAQWRHLNMSRWLWHI